MGWRLLLLGQQPFELAQLAKEASGGLLHGLVLWELLHGLVELKVEELLDADAPHLRLLPDAMVIEETRQEEPCAIGLNEEHLLAAVQDSVDKLVVLISLVQKCG